MAIKKIREKFVDLSAIWRPMAEGSSNLKQSCAGKLTRLPLGVRQGCLVSPIVFNIFLERIMCEALGDHEGSVSIGGRLITNFRFADDIVIKAEEEEQLTSWYTVSIQPPRSTQWRLVQTRQKK